MAEDLESNPWITKSETVAYENPWIRLEHHEVITPGGSDGIYGVVRFKNLAIGIIPLDENYNTWIVGQFRYPHNKYSWEMPEGGGALIADPIESAKRELLEECGLKAKNWKLIQKMDLSNSVCDEEALIYIATELTEHKALPEDTEQLVIKKIPFSEMFTMVLNDEIRDGMTVAAVFKVKYMIDQGLL